VPEKPFVSLHNHTEYSVLDGLGNIKTQGNRIGYVERAVQLGMPALGIMDHGNVCGTPEFYAECRKQGIEPVLGEEFYFVPDAAWRPEKGQKGGVDRHHVGVMARGFEGWKVLAELSTATHKQYYYKPLLDRALVESLGDATQHLTVLSGCAASRLSTLLLEERDEEAVEELLWWREMFPHYYIELMHHDTDFDKRLNEALIDLAKRYDVPWVITNDPHFVVPEDDCHHDTLLAIQTASDIDDPNRFRFDGHGYHLRSRSEMRRTFAQYGEEIWKPGARNTLRIARESHTRIPSWETRTWQIPKFPDVDDAYRELRRLTIRGLDERGLRGDAASVSRAKSELKVFKEAGIADFLLITRDSIIDAVEQGIRVGPGRGSVCGTFVGYLIGLHKINSIKYNLLFERFLNPARPRMPDIDTDFSQRRRGEVFERTIDKYGIDNVVHVCTYGRMQVKKAFQSLARAHGVGFQDRIRLSKDIVEDDDGNFILPAEITEKYPELEAQLQRLAGVKVSVSAHPAGVIIADPTARIREQVPEMYIASSKRFVGQFDLDAVEHMGLMKQDFLGLRTLDTIDETLELIKRFRGEEFDPDEWSPDDEPGDDEVYKMLAKGRTHGVFQMEGPTNQRGCRDVKPKNFEDIVSITSLYRTGAISAGFPKIFNENRRNGQEAIPYVHRALKPILGDTWGVVLYQEQVMEFGRTLAGFNMVQVDDIKESIKHKKSDLLKSMKAPFIKGCMETSGMSKGQAAECWKMIEGYSGYGYNRSHAVAYSFLTYQTARLKRFYPAEFICGLLRTVDDKDKRDGYLREAVELGITILPPDINESEAGAVPVVLEGSDTPNAIRLGFTDYAGIGDKVAEKIVSLRPVGENESDGYESVAEVEAAVRNIGTMKILLQGSALESLGAKGDKARTEELLNWTFDDRMEPVRRKYRDQIDLPRRDEDRCTIVGEIVSATKGKTKTNKAYMTWKVRYSITQSFDIRLWSETEKYWSLGKGSIVMVQGTWEGRWQNISVGNPRMVKVIKRVKA
jgi:DNA polymerase-3 subunit alpha